MPETSDAEGRSMRGALHAEWTKLRTTPGTIWLLSAVITLTAAVERAVKNREQRVVAVVSLRREDCGGDGSPRSAAAARPARP